MKSTSVKIIRDKNFYLEKISKYKFECGCKLGAIFTPTLKFGCKLGAIFFTVTLIMFIGIEFYIWLNPEIPINHTKINLIGPVIIFTSAILGKLIGIGLAKIKLRIVYNKYNQLKEINKKW